jgi:hypothetical protein
LGQRYARKYKGKPAPLDVRDADIGKLLAEHILFGWKGFKEEYSEDHARELLISPRGRSLRNQVTWAATQVGEKEVEFIVDATKNFVTPSVTN